MKERDKIQIQCLKGKNPYIQTAHLANGKMIYLVKTVDDDHHLYELPPEIQNIVLDWVFWNFYPAQKLYPHSIQASSPAIKAQADGYSGLPIIGRQDLNRYGKRKWC